MSISYALLVGAIALEIYAMISFLSSDWTVIWLTNQKRHPVIRHIVHLRMTIYSNVKDDGSDRRWCGSIGQFNMVDFCLENMASSKSKEGRDFFWRNSKNLKKHKHVYFERVSDDMKEVIFEHVCEHARLGEISKQKGEGLIRLFPGLSHVIRCTISDMDLDESILLWHLVTDLCYNADLNDPVEKKDHFVDNNNNSPHHRVSKLLSDYMLYLLVMRPFMLPKGIGQVRFELSVQQALDCFQHFDLSGGRGDRDSACSELLLRRHYPRGVPWIIREARNLALSWQGELQEEGEREEASIRDADGQEWGKWKLICKVWVEILCCAASQCRWTSHAPQLGRGGELLTHVSLLMAHFGLTDPMANVTF